jgi:hypothetical protein
MLAQLGRARQGAASTSKLEDASTMVRLAHLWLSAGWLHGASLGGPQPGRNRLCRPVCDVMAARALEARHSAP